MQHDSIYGREDYERPSSSTLVNAGRSGNIDTLKRCLSLIDVASEDNSEILIDIVSPDEDGNYSEHLTQDVCDDIVKSFFDCGYSDISSLCACLSSILNSTKDRTTAMRFIRSVIKATPDVNCVESRHGETHGSLLHTLHDVDALSASEIVDLLLERGVDVNAVNNKGETALYCASAAEHCFQMVDMLLRARADVDLVNNDGNSALHMACTSGLNHEVAELLVSRGANVNVQSKSYFTPLYIACCQGNAELVRILIGAGADFIVQAKLYNNTHYSLLSVAMMFGYLDVGRVLVEAKADLNAQSSSLDTALHLAAQTLNSTESVRLLLEANADVTIVNVDGDTALHTACQCGFDDVVNLLTSTMCQRGLVEQGPVDYFTLVDACCNGNIATVKRCLSSGKLDINNRRWDENAGFMDRCDVFRTVLKPDRLSTYNANLTQDVCDELVQLFIDAGYRDIFWVCRYLSELQSTEVSASAMRFIRSFMRAIPDVNLIPPTSSSKPCSALHVFYKVQGPDATEVVDTLVRRGLDVDLVDDSGKTALFKTCLAEPNHSMARALIKAGADINIVGKTRTSCLHRACSDLDIAMIMVLFEAGADVNSVDQHGNNALHLICNHSYRKIIFLLPLVQSIVDKSDNVNLASLHGSTPLLHACYHAQPEVVDILLKAGARVDALEELHQKTPLHLVSESLGERVRCAELLIKAKANINILSYDCHQTPLHLACVRQKTDMIEYLIKVNADVMVVDDNQMTPLHIACDNGDAMIVSLLCQHAFDALL